jgi:adenosylcobinamide-GDP ribazoletransferase
MRQLILALQFLTVFPLKMKGDVSEEEIGQSAVFFPLVGAFQGLLAIVAAFLSAKYLGEEIAPAMVLLALAASNGGLHLDGLADTADAVAVKSTGDEPSDINRRLAAMKDSSAGPTGVMAVVFDILLKFLLLNMLFSGLGKTAFYSLLLLMAVYSKWAMVPPMYYGRPARKDGLGRIFMLNVQSGVLLLSTLLTVMLSVVAYRFWFGHSYSMHKVVLFPALLCGLYLFGWASAKCSETRFGGLTGDIFGAISEVSEILVLLGVSAWLRRSI